MATIRSSCDSHDGIEIDTKNVSVLVYDHRYSDAESYQYRFRCPVDSKIIIKVIKPRTSNLLIASGCAVEYIDYPQETSSADLTELTHDTVIDFHNLLNTIGLQNIAQEFEF